MASVTGRLIAVDARRYVGKGYVFGGDASSPGIWDCSSYVSYVLGHDLRLALPGGRWNGPGMPPHAHGPVVMDYVNWTGARPVTAPEAGDLCCWAGLGADGHIGIAVNSSEMVSALNPGLGVAVTPIVGTGPSNVPLVYRRITGLAGGAGLPSIAAPSGAKSPPAAIVVFAVAAGLVLVGAMLIIPAGTALIARRVIS